MAPPPVDPHRRSQQRPRGGATYDKPPLDHASLLRRMQDRGLDVPDEDRATRYLRQVGYYRVSPYMIPFQVAPGDHVFRRGAAFDDVLSLYIFDRQLRLLVLDGLERIEVAIRAALTDHMATRSGDAHWYLRETYFADLSSHRKLIADLESLVTSHLRKAPESTGDSLTYPSALEHYVTRYREPVLPPSWVMVEELTIGQLERTVGNLADRADRTAIAKSLGINDALLRSWLRSYVRVRNICAHHGRLWNRGLGVYPALPASRQIEWLEHPQALTSDVHKYRSRRLYPVLVSIQCVLGTVSPGSTWASRLFDLVDRYPAVPLRAMGMPRDWVSDSFWARRISP